jgi:predicted RNA methylase
VPGWRTWSLDALSVVRPALLARRRSRADGRHARGVYYTPPELAAGLIALALPPRATAPRGAGFAVLDPACGCGNLLVPALRALIAADPAAAEAAPEARARIAAALVPCIAGLDTDPLAVEVTRTRLAWEAGGVTEGMRVQQGDALVQLADDAPGAWDVVLGNPPFLSRLRRDSALPAETVARVREVLGLPARATIDAAALFLGLAGRAVRRGGRVAMVQPVSFLASEGAEPVRRRLALDGALHALWIPTVRFAGTGVQVAVVAWEREGPRQVAGAVGHGARAPASPGTLRDMDVLAGSPGWGALAAEALGVPGVTLPEHVRTLGGIARIEADYRDAFYGLVPAVREAHDDEVPSRTTPGLLVTGHVDPARLRWGRVPCRFAGRRFVRPVVDLAVLQGVDPDRAAWARRRATPRVVLATQGRVLEAAADPAGAWVNVTPTITVTPHDPGDLWRVLAMLSAPCVSAALASRATGTGLSLGALRVGAGAIRALPLPVDAVAWAHAADAARMAMTADESTWHEALAVLGAAADAAYGLSDTARLRWWREGATARRVRR